MGSGCSTAVCPSPGDFTLLDQQRESVLQVEFQSLLDNEVARYFIGEHMKRAGLQSAFTCWCDVSDFKKLTVTSPQITQRALHILRNYAANQSIVKLDANDKKYISDIAIHVDLWRVKERFLSNCSGRTGALTSTDSTVVDLSADNGSPAYSSDRYVSKKNSELKMDCFDWLQAKVFSQLLCRPFLKMQNSREYLRMCAAMHSATNAAYFDDFDFVDFLGKGAYGEVIKVRKRCSGRLYAMKIQPKRIGKVHSSRGRRQELEMRALATCNHPYIASLEHAFNSRSMSVLVMELGTGVDMRTYIKRMPDGRCTAAMTQFFAAEITCALAYVHQRGLIFRDLKPQNVLVNNDGHIMLVDFGAVADVGGELMVKARNSRAMLALSILGNIRSDFNAPVDKLGGEIVCEQPTISENVIIPPRAVSIVGTTSFMAPEMLKLLLLDDTCYSDTGYTKAVDWWSLGVTMYILLTGRAPFHSSEMAALFRREDGVTSPTTAEVYCFFGVVDYHREGLAGHDGAISFLKAILEPNEEKRLGYGFMGSEDVKAHEYFATVNWGAIARKEASPPECIHKRSTITSLLESMAPVQVHPQPKFSNIDAYLLDAGHASWLEPYCYDRQPYASNWDYTSPSSLFHDP